MTKLDSITNLQEFGKVPPQAIDTEKALLGTLLAYPDSINDIIDILIPEMFYRDSHQKIYNAIKGLFDRGEKSDLITITEYLRNLNELDGTGGPIYLTKLIELASSFSMIENYALIIKQKYIARELIRFGTELQNRSFDMMIDVSDLIEYAETELMGITGKTVRKKYKPISEIVDSVINKIEKIQTGEIKLIGVPSGFTDLDRRTGGFKEKEYILIAGRPSMGKTALALQIAKNCALLKNPVAIFSCEMAEEELGRRRLAGDSGKSNIELLNGKGDIDELLKASEYLIGLPLYIDDTSAISLIELRAKTRRLVIEHGIKMIIVDYLQLMTSKGDSREQEVAAISRGLKSIAKDLNIAVIGISQLNRRLEATADKRPNLSDLRESGSLEQDADIVLFVYRPEIYKIPEIKFGDSLVDTKNLIIVPIAKNRNGPVTEIALQCNDSLTEIKEYIEEFETQNQPF